MLSDSNDDPPFVRSKEILTHAVCTERHQYADCETLPSPKNNFKTKFGYCENIKGDSRICDYLRGRIFVVKNEEIECMFSILQIEY